MRKTDENRAENYIKKHHFKRRWIVFALFVSLLTGTGTLYMLNKPATAMSLISPPPIARPSDKIYISNK